MSQSESKPRRRPQARPCGELLESRSLLTGGAGNTFAILPVTIDKPGGTVQVPFTIDPANFTLPKHKLALGIDVVAVDGSTVKPLITRVDGPHGIVPQTFHSIYDPRLSHAAVASGAGTSAVLTPISQFPTNPNRPITDMVTITAEKNTSGKLFVGFYLPGDANGDGKVNATDTQAVFNALGTVSTDQNYNMDADANRDGRVGKIDFAYVRQNQGVATTITPAVTSDLDPSSVTQAGTRNTTKTAVTFVGQGSPGAKIAYADVTGKIPPVLAIVGPDGKYTRPINVNPGDNTFRVTSLDSFGQTITGTIKPVTRLVAAPTPTGQLRDDDQHLAATGDARRPGRRVARGSFREEFGRVRAGRERASGVALRPVVQTRLPARTRPGSPVDPRSLDPGAGGFLQSGLRGEVGAGSGRATGPATHFPARLAHDPPLRQSAGQRRLRRRGLPGRRQAAPGQPPGQPLPPPRAPRQDRQRRRPALECQRGAGPDRSSRATTSTSGARPRSSRGRSRSSSRTSRSIDPTRVEPEDFLPQSVAERRQAHGAAPRAPARR